MASTPVTWNGSDSQGNPLLWDSVLTWNGVLPQPTRRMPILHVLRDWAEGPDAGLHGRAQTVHASLYTSGLWTVPPNPAIPVTAAALATGISDFDAAMAAADGGGPEETAAKNDKRAVLVDLLRELASYVDDNHGNDMAKLLASGFQAASTNRAQSPLDIPLIKEITNNGSGKLGVRIAPVANAKSFEARYALIPPGGAAGPWQHGGTFPNSRSILISGLTPGGNYQIQIRAVGGSTGYSEWSDPITHMSM